MESFREPSIQAATDDAPAEDRALRPQRMDEMVGQRAVHERLSIAIDAARKRGETLGHILLDGPPGLGKTTFATCIPRELGTSLQIASGAVVWSYGHAANLEAIACDGRNTYIGGAAGGGHLAAVTGAISRPPVPGRPAVPAPERPFQQR